MPTKLGTDWASIGLDTFIEASSLQLSSLPSPAPTPIDEL